MNWQHEVRRAPCVPAVVLAVLGILLDRYLSLPGYVWPLTVGIGLIGWLVRQNGIALMICIASLAGLHHHLHCHHFPDDDVGRRATDEPRLVQLRGRVLESPSIDRPTKTDPLRSIPESIRTHVVLEAQDLVDGNGARPVSGKVATTLFGANAILQVNDVLQFTGWLTRPRAPDNPGERDRSADARDNRIRATFFVRHVNDAATGPQANSAWTWGGFFSSARTWSEQILRDRLPADVTGLAAALLLGDTTAMSRSEWEKYVRTGVVHVLAVSGQHLSILAGFAWITFRTLGVTRRHSALMVALGIAFYASLVGWRPPVSRATVMVLVSCWATWLRRPALPANMLALALLVVLILNPTDLLDPGCQFSFISIAILVWGIPHWIKYEPDRLAQLETKLKPVWFQWLRLAGTNIGRAYLVTLIIFALLAPLTMIWYHMLSPVGVLIGPPAILLASVALLFGFGLLISAAIAPILAAVISQALNWSLALLAWMVEGAEQLSGSWFYVGTVELWWVIGFYVLLAIALWWPKVRAQTQWCAAGGLGWVIVGLALSLHRPTPDGLRVTFLAVGHGGATVMELPDGRVLLYDCGSMNGPDVTHRIIAPFLWHRGVRKLDEVFLSHADLDHFNGLPSLLQRFHVGRVSITPSFAVKPIPAVAQVLDELSRRQIPVVVRQSGDRMSAGDVDFEVWHPPSVGPIGPENARSLVMAIQHENHRFVLTGDLDLEGRPMVMARPRESIDVWLAPHHGGRSANPIELAAWANPRISVAHNATGEARFALENYERVGSRMFGTWPHGAVTILSRRGQISVETFRSRQLVRLPDQEFAAKRAVLPVVESTAIGYDDERSLLHRFFRRPESPSHVPSTHRFYAH